MKSLRLSRFTIVKSYVMHPEETSEVTAPGTKENEKIFDVPRNLESDALRNPENADSCGRALTRYNVVPEAFLTSCWITKHRVLTLAIFVSTARVQGTPKLSNLLIESSHGV